MMEFDPAIRPVTAHDLANARVQDFVILVDQLRCGIDEAMTVSEKRREFSEREVAVVIDRETQNLSSVLLVVGGNIRPASEK